MPVVELANTANTLHATLVTDATTQRVTGICWIDQQTIVANDLHGLVHQARLRINRVYLEILAHLPTRSLDRPVLALPHR